MELQRPDVVPAPPAASTWAAQPATTAHAALLDGATLTGEASRRQHSVRVGLWLDEAGWVRRARWRADGGGAVAAYAEAACSLLEAGLDPSRLDAEALRSVVPQPGPVDPDLAELVAFAIEAALMARGAQGV